MRTLQIVCAASSREGWLLPLCSLFPANGWLVGDANVRPTQNDRAAPAALSRALRAGGGTGE